MSCIAKTPAFPVSFTLKNGKTLVIRRMQPDDLAAYSRVTALGYQETRFLTRGPEDPPIPAEALLEFIRETMNSDREILLAASYEGEVVGFADLTACSNRKKFSHRCELSLCVLKDYWSLGIGRALTTALIDFACGAGYEQIELCVAGDNERAIGLYQSLAFHDTGRQPHAMKHGEGDYSDWVFMTRFLH